MKAILALLLALVPGSMASGPDQSLPGDRVKLGKVGSTDKTIEVMKSATTATNPKIKWNNTTSKLQFSNDGSTFKNFGSGSGGAGGTNVITENFDFEAGVTQNWTDSASVVTAESSSPLFDSVSAKMTATASSQTYTSDAYTIPVGMRSQPCIGAFKYSTAEATNKYKIQVLDGSNNVLVENSLDATTKTENAYAPFACPSSGSIKLRLTSTGSAVAITIDNAFLGNDYRLADITQATLYATVKVASCAAAHSLSTSSSYATMGTQTGCTYTITGSSNITAPGTNVMGFTATSLPPGEYTIIYDGAMDCSLGGGVQYCQFQLHDGTNASREAQTVYGVNTSGQTGVPGATYSFAYTTTQSNITFQFRARSSNSNTAKVYGVDGSAGAPPGVFKIYRFPTSSDSGVRIDQLGWHVDANISGANPSLGTSSVSTYTGIENGSLTLTNNSGNGVIAAQIPCSSTNAPSGTTCSSGNESVGVSFNLPAAGDVLACASFTYYADTGSGNIDASFQIVETPNNAQTISQEGKSRVATGADKGGSTFSRPYSPYRLCGNFTFTSSGQKTIRLMYEQLVSGAITSSLVLADANSSVGQRDIHWEVYPLNYLSGAMPVFKGMVTSNTSSQERIERATIAEGANCTSNPCTITRQSGSWLSSVTWNSAGNMTLNIAAGIFSGAPSCSGMSSQMGFTTGSNPTSTSFNFVTRDSAASAANAQGINVICVGPK